jgi:hypothetical protein
MSDYWLGWVTGLLGGFLIGFAIGGEVRMKIHARYFKRCVPR